MWFWFVFPLWLEILNISSCVFLAICSSSSLHRIIVSLGDFFLIPTMNRLGNNLAKQFYLQHLQKIKYLGINLTKEVKDLYNKSINHWRNKLKKQSEYGKISYDLGLIELRPWKQQYYQKKSVYSIKIPIAFLRLKNRP
jgi:hypothetical protein